MSLHLSLTQTLLESGTMLSKRPGDFVFASEGLKGATVRLSFRVELEIHPSACAPSIGRHGQEAPGAGESRRCLPPAARRAGLLGILKRA